MSKLINFLLVVVILAGVAMLLYPTASDQYNKYLNARRIYSYKRTTEAIPRQDNREMLEAARAYNATLGNAVFRDAFSDEKDEAAGAYMDLLNPAGDGVMGVVEIPKIGVRLPIFHGTAEESLQRGVGHMEGTSLPVGGPGTHAGLAGHRGLPSARLFTDLDQLAQGDVFYISVLGELLPYQVDQVLEVLPSEMEHLARVEGEDYVTLVTCTPYGVNTHRLLVRGARVDMQNIADLLALSDRVDDLPFWQGVLVCAAPVALIGLIGMLLIRPKKRFLR